MVLSPFVILILWFCAGPLDAFYDTTLQRELQDGKVNKMLQRELCNLYTLQRATPVL